MRDQYAGDITDYLKFAFLRAVTPPGAHLGEAWYYVDRHDQRADGRHDEYLADPRYEVLDPPLYALLAARNPSVVHLEQLPIWPGAVTFHRQPLPAASGRAAWFDGLLGAMAHTDVIFADPDNGVAPSASRKHASHEEIERLAARGRPVFFIRFPHRTAKHDAQREALHETFRPFEPATLTTCVRVPNVCGGGAPRIRWFVALNATQTIREAMQAFASRVSALPGGRASFA